MSSIVWLVILYVVIRRLWRKHPAFREYVKLFLGGHTHDKAVAILEKEQVRQKAERKAAASPKTHAPQLAKPIVTPASQNPVLKTPHRSEKQFREL